MWFASFSFQSYRFLPQIFSRSIFGVQTILLSLFWWTDPFNITYCSCGLSRWLSGKESAYQAGDVGLIPGWGRSPGEGNGTHSSILAWRIPWTEISGGLQSMGLQRVGHNLVIKQQQQLLLLWYLQSDIKIVILALFLFCGCRGLLKLRH